MSIVTLAQAKEQLNIDPGDVSDDAELQEYVDAIAPMAEEYKHEVIAQRTVTEDLEVHRGCGWGPQRFALTYAPVISLTSVTLWDGSQAWDVSQMRASPAGVVRVMAGPAVTGLVTVTYEAGYAVVPLNYVRGALIILAHIWETQRGRGTVMSGVVGAEEHFRQPGEWFTIPNKAKEAFGPPRPVVA